MSRDLQEGPTAAEVPQMIDTAHRLAMLALQSNRYTDDPEYRDAVDDVLGWSFDQPRYPSTPIPTIAVFVEGGLIQDICFDSPARIIVIDFDTDSEDAELYTYPSGETSRANISVWHRAKGFDFDDAEVMRAALRAAGAV